MAHPTIFALASGALPCAVAVVRISGPEAGKVFGMFHVKQPKPRYARLSVLREASGQPLDQVLVFWYPAPASFTGEDVVELHLHGSPAVVQRLFVLLGQNPGWRLAEPGEFSRRAFENGRMDLTEVEALSDLISAQTEAQRLQALHQYSGQLRELYEAWRGALLKLRAAVEADFDFADEEDVPGSVAKTVSQDTHTLAARIRRHLDDGRKGEIIRQGLRVVLAGAPNVGKSSLLNALAERDVAIVTDQPGTTRDVLQVSLNLDGYLVVVSDTAGLRLTQDEIEAEGIRRAEAAAHQADLILWLESADDSINIPPESEWNRGGILVEKNGFRKPVLLVRSRADLSDDLQQADSSTRDVVWVSSKTGFGLDQLIDHIKRFASVSSAGHKGSQEEQVLITRIRHRLALEDAVTALERAEQEDLALELRVEHLRTASDALGRIIGRIDVEDILGHIFAEFCIGK